MAGLVLLICSLVVYTGDRPVEWMIMADSIKLDPERGLAPHLMVCPRCGKDSGIALLGDRPYKDVCKDCGAVCYGGWEKSACPRCGGGNRDRVKLSESERIYTLCEECVDQQRQALRRVTEEGLVLVKCDECGMTGILDDAAGCARIREELGDRFSRREDGTYPLCGLQFTKCSEHGDLATGEEDAETE